MEPISPQNISNEAHLILLEQKVDYLVTQARAAARARKITLILTLLFVVGPVVLMMFFLPSAMNSLTSSYQIPQ